jgi:anti-anti-sigma factor
MTLNGAELQRSGPDAARRQEVEMEIVVRKKGKVEILDFSGRVTIVEESIMRDTFKERLAAGQRLFIFNLTNVPYMDSATIGETVACLKRANEHQGAIKIVLSAGGKVDELFHLTALDRVFALFRDEEEALASFIP